MQQHKTEPLKYTVMHVTVKQKGLLIEFPFRLTGTTKCVMVLTVILVIFIPPVLAVIRDHVTAAASESTTEHHQVSSSSSIAALKTEDAPSSIAPSANHRQLCSEAHAQTPSCVAQKFGARVVCSEFNE